MEYLTKCEHGVINRARNTMFGYQGWGSVCRDENGVLYAVSSSFRLAHICPFGKTAMYISKDEGKTWTPPIVINDTYLDDRDAGIVYLGNGRMVVSWFCHPARMLTDNWYITIRNRMTKGETPLAIGMLNSFGSIPKEYAGGGSFVRVSEDYGVTWSDTITVPVSAPHGPNLCKDGTLIYLGKELYSLKSAPTEAQIIAYASKDGGYTWEKRGVCEKPAEYDWHHFHEPHVIELDDGTLYGMIRAQGPDVAVNNSFTIFDTRSTDGGITWSPWRPLNVCGSPPHLLKTKSGLLICTFGRRVAPFGQRAMISKDGGLTWSEDFAIDDRGIDIDLGYPCSVELDDGTIFTMYYQKYTDEATGKTDEKTSILYTKWQLK